MIKKLLSDKKPKDEKHEFYVVVPFKIKALPLQAEEAFVISDGDYPTWLVKVTASGKTVAPKPTPVEPKD